MKFPWPRSTFHYETLSEKMLASLRLRWTRVPRRSKCVVPGDHVAKSNTARKHDKYGFTRRQSDSWDANDLAILPAHLRPDQSETLDLILRQKIYLLQSRRGYRANTDSHVLAYFAWNTLHQLHDQIRTTPQRVLDLGAGNGIVSIIFSKAQATSELHLIELQEQLVNRARKNLELNDLNGIVTQHDLVSDTLPPGLESSSDVILINPPFYPQRNLLLPQNRERLLSRIETSATLSDFLRAAASACDVSNPHSFIALIHDYRELQRILQCAHKCNLDIIESREMIHRCGERPTRVLMRLRPRYKRYNDHDENKQIILNECPKVLPKDHKFSYPPIKLHNDSGFKNRYHDGIEEFLHTLPLPSLRIGRLSESTSDYT